MQLWQIIIIVPVHVCRMFIRNFVLFYKLFVEYFENILRFILVYCFRARVIFWEQREDTLIPSVWHKQKTIISFWEPRLPLVYTHHLITMDPIYPANQTLCTCPAVLPPSSGMLTLPPWRQDLWILVNRYLRDILCHNRTWTQGQGLPPPPTELHTFCPVVLAILMEICTLMWPWDMA